MQPNDAEDAGLVTVEQALFLHTVAVVEFGGAPELRDRGLLESALARPAAGLGEVRLFRTPHARAAALLEAIVRNHPFIDGNKRTAVMVAAFSLEREGFVLTATNDALADMALALVNREIDGDRVAEWLESHSEPKDRLADHTSAG